MKFAGKVAVITGGAAGIGLAMGEALARDGASIAILEIDEAKSREAVAALEALGARAVYQICDVSDEAAVDKAVAAIVEELGGVDILINNAAKHLAFYNQAPTKLPRDHWRLMLELNVVGVVNCSAACRPSMQQRGGGVIINISSIASVSLTGAYGVSKLAVRGLTVALAQEFAADGIRVCGIAPGMVDSPAATAGVASALADRLVNDFQLIKRPGRMDDLVKALFYLASDDASFVTGETLIVGGGYPLRP